MANYKAKTFITEHTADFKLEGGGGDAGGEIIKMNEVPANLYVTDDYINIWITHSAFDREMHGTALVSNGGDFGLYITGSSCDWSLESPSGSDNFGFIYIQRDVAVYPIYSYHQVTLSPDAPDEALGYSNKTSYGNKLSAFYVKDK